MEDDVFGKSVVEERPHLCKRLTVNGAMTDRVSLNYFVLLHHILFSYSIN